MKTLEEREKRAREIREIIVEAVSAADRIILDGSDGSCEETDFLTAEVAEIMVKKAMLPFNRNLSKRDLD